MFSLNGDHAILLMTLVVIHIRKQTLCRQLNTTPSVTQQCWDFFSVQRLKKRCVLYLNFKKILPLFHSSRVIFLQQLSHFFVLVILQQMSHFIFLVKSGVTHFPTLTFRSLFLYSLYFSSLLFYFLSLQTFYNLCFERNASVIMKRMK